MEDLKSSCIVIFCCFYCGETFPGGMFARSMILAIIYLLNLCESFEEFIPVPASTTKS